MQTQIHIEALAGLYVYWTKNPTDRPYAEKQTSRHFYLLEGSCRFLIPGLEDTIRINVEATLTGDLLRLVMTIANKRMLRQIGQDSDWDHITGNVGRTFRLHEEMTGPRNWPRAGESFLGWSEQ